MIDTHKLYSAAAPAALIALISLGPLAPQQSLAGPFDGDRMVQVTTDGHLMRDVPEAGSVRVVIDNQGRRLLIDRSNLVIGFEIPSWQFRSQHNGANRDRIARNHEDWGREDWGWRHRDNRNWDDQDRITGSNQYPPRPRRDRLATAEPRSRIERRDLNPTTGTVPAVGDYPRIIKAPSLPDPAPSPAPVRQSARASKLNKAQVVALQVYLDRNGFSPGVIDGRMGSNVQKALDAWREATGERIDPANTELILDRLATDGGLAFSTYTITAKDAAGPFIASVPRDYAAKARLDRLAFTSTLEMLAERFHMDERYLRELNPGVEFNRPGVQIKVVATAEKKSGVVTRIVADKSRKQLRAYNANGKLLTAYPATIGSAATPSPSGEFTIERVARNPGYTYNPRINFTQGNNTRILEVPPGPNGPVGSIWIALSKPTYGIHGTPSPNNIGKTASHGCVRLTNWDAEELAGLVAPGVNVSFVD